MTEQPSSQPKTDIEQGEKPKPNNHRWKSIRSWKLDIRWLSIFGISIACYLPALLIVLISSSILKPVSTQTQLNLTQKQIDQVNEEVKKALESQPKEARTAALAQKKATDDSLVAQGYIDAQIREKSEKAAQDKIEELKENWKGDLFSQISFPVIFAIASIFAAFAIKDILTEILKEQEKERIKQELRSELRNAIVPEAIDHVLYEHESYSYWLEYQMLKVEINQIISEIRQTSLNPPLEEAEKRNKFVLEKAIQRLNFSLSRIANKIKIEDFKLLKDTQKQALAVKIRTMGLSRTIEDHLIGELNKDSQTLNRQENQSQTVIEKIHTRIDNLVDVELGLLIATLDKTHANEDSSDIERRNGWLNSLVAYLKRDKVRESQARVERIDQTRPNLAPLRKDKS